MGTGPGVMQRKILGALADGPKSYDDLSVLLFGPGWDHGQRANMVRALGALSLRGLVEVRPAWWWFSQGVGFSDLEMAAGLPGTPSAAETSHARPAVAG